MLFAAPDVPEALHKRGSNRRNRRHHGNNAAVGHVALCLTLARAPAWGRKARPRRSQRRVAARPQARSSVPHRASSSAAGAHSQRREWRTGRKRQTRAIRGGEELAEREAVQAD
eukprot:2575824-Pleurochrysis_carterae.AAC.6